MEIKEMDMEQVENRMTEIKVELADADEARLAELTDEVEALENRKAEIRAEIENRKAEIAEVANGEGHKIEEIIEERKVMGIEEIRNSKAYIDAYANYIKTGKDDEVRALLTTNATVSGAYLPVPTIVEGRIRTAWDRLGLMQLVRKTFAKGNLKVGFELSADGAVVHNEGTAYPTEEALTFGVVELKPESIKKWITISDEAYDMGGEEFLYYIYDEITYRIAKKAQEILLSKITALTASAIRRLIPHFHPQTY